MKYRCQYRYSNDLGKQEHAWTVVGARLAIHLHITQLGERFDKPFREPHGGIEVHYRQPPSYMRDDAPSHDYCWLLKCPCWHDGSSLQATETWIPRWQRNPHNHDAMFEALKDVLEAHDTLEEKESA